MKLLLRLKTQYARKICRKFQPLTPVVVGSNPPFSSKVHFASFVTKRNIHNSGFKTLWFDPSLYPHLILFLTSGVHCVYTLSQKEYLRSCNGRDQNNGFSPLLWNYYYVSKLNTLEKFVENFSLSLQWSWVRIRHFPQKCILPHS